MVLRCTIPPTAGTTGLVLLRLPLPTGTSCSSILVVFGPRTSTTGTAGSLSAAWLGSQA